MKRDLSLLAHTQFDVIIVGGGITGACLAHDASLRGLRVALLEKADFGMSTSAASSKLLHGGIRYLQQFQFGKVRESARERCIFQVIAPHLTQYIPFMVPTVQGSFMKGASAMKGGMFLYNLICSGLNKMISDSGKRVPKGKFYTKNEAVALVPLLAGIEGMSGAHTLFESHMYSSERMTLAFMKTAVSNGAQIANHVKVIRFLKDNNSIVGVVGRDELNGKEFEIQGTLVANAAGPFIPQLNQSMQNLQLNKNTTGYSKGIHIVTKQICKDFALAIGSTKKTEGLVTRGGRHFFVIPWRDRSLIGTTNVPYEGNLDDLSVTQKDVKDFLADINALLPEIQLHDEDLYYAFTGLYPLVSEEIKTDTYQGTGTYQIVDHCQVDGVEGVISVLGAKYTTGRIVAEKAIDIVLKKLGKQQEICQTAVTRLLEGRVDDLHGFIAAKKQQYDGIVAAGSVEYLVNVHGSEIDTVIKYLLREESFLNKLTVDRETLVGEIYYAMDEEMAFTLSDVVFARTGLGTIGPPGADILLRVAQIMAERLDWSTEKMEAEIESVEAQYSYLVNV